MKKKEMKKRIVAGVMAGALVAGLCVTAPFVTEAATEHWNDASVSGESTEWTNWKNNWANYSKNYENVSLTPGKDETELNFAWYSHTEEKGSVKIWKKSEGESKAVVFEASGKGTKVVDNKGNDVKNTKYADYTYYSNKVTATGLEENTEYQYKVYQNGAWGETKDYKKGSFSNYNIMYVGDPQIGASKKQVASDGQVMTNNPDAKDDNLAARNDAFNWNSVLNQAVSAHNIDFMISAGDQVNASTYEDEYAGYLGASALSFLPVATTIGNHDSTSGQYTSHFNNPNTFAANDSVYAAGATAAGTDYYYTYGDVLFIMIDTNNYNCATHKSVIDKAVKENPDAKWRIVTFHQDIYGSGYDHSDSDGMVLRTQLTPIFDEYDIDMVLQGHDHTYSRTFQLSSNGKAEDYTSWTSSPKVETQQEEFQKENDSCYNIDNYTKSGTVVDPEGTVYMEANSSTGSKFYQLIYRKQDYVAERSQTWTPSYSILNVSDTALTITTYDAQSGEELAGSSSYTIVKEADKTALNETIKAAEEKLKDESQYTEASLTEAKTALTEAIVVQENAKALATEIADASSKLSQAVAKLEKKPEEKKTEQTVTVTKTNETISFEGVPADSTTVSVNKTTAKKLSASKKKATLTWKKVSNATGYLVIYADNKKLTKNANSVLVKGKSKTSLKIKGLKSGKKVYAKVCAYKESGGAMTCGKFSSVLSAKVK